MAFSDREAAAQALEATVARLRSEVAGLRQAMRHRAVIEQAKGETLTRESVVVAVE